MTSPTAVRAIHAVLVMATDLARSVEDLNDCLKANRRVIDRLQQVAPDLWTDLRDRTIAKRAALSAPPPAKPPAPPPATQLRLGL